MMRLSMASAASQWRQVRSVQVQASASSSSSRYMCSSLGMSIGTGCRVLVSVVIKDFCFLGLVFYWQLGQGVLYQRSCWSWWLV